MIFPLNCCCCCCCYYYCCYYYCCYYYYRFMAPWTVSGTTRGSQYQKGKTRKVKPNLAGFTGARDSEWQWHQLSICKSASHLRQITMPASHHSVFYRPNALPATQPTASKHWRQKHWRQMIFPLNLHTNIRAQMLSLGGKRNSFCKDLQ